VTLLSGWTDAGQVHCFVKVPKICEGLLNILFRGCRAGGLGRQHGVISYVKMCELSELSELRVLLLRFRPGGSVRLKRLMRLKPGFSPPFELEVDGKTAFLQEARMVFPPAAGPVSGHLWCQVVKDLSMHRKRTLDALLLITRSSSHSSLGEGTQTGKRGISC
jgi:hypothetical protein